MQKRLLPMTIIALALGIVGTGLYLVPASRDDMPRRILYDNAGGTVVFEHARHVTAVAAPSGQDRNCAACHHESPVARDKPVACASCHGATFDESFRKKHVAAFNDNAACATCHHRELDRKKWGHKRHVEELGLACTDCHHSADIEPEPQNCADCHESGVAPGRQAREEGTPPALADAVHQKCLSCHEDLFAAGAKGCASCHAVIKVRDRLPAEGLVKLNSLYTDCAVCHGKKAQDLVPGRMDAFHGQCMTCHRKVGKGPFEKTQCGQCHTK